MSKELIAKLAVIQKTLKAPKGQFNKFGKYKYRSCEDILEGLKLVLDGLVVTVEDDVKIVGDRVYIKSTATLTDGESSISNSAFARESLTKKGMDDSQITGTASSYARKYA
ncbi:MAG: ERF family protein, partial [Aliivibrio sp.]|nr:ERF family protein [Aliivibrio sp.]